MLPLIVTSRAGVVSNAAVTNIDDVALSTKLRMMMVYHIASRLLSRLNWVLLLIEHLLRSVVIDRLEDLMSLELRSFKLLRKVRSNIKSEFRFMTHP